MERESDELILLDEIEVLEVDEDEHYELQLVEPQVYIQIEVVIIDELQHLQ